MAVSTSPPSLSLSKLCCSSPPSPTTKLQTRKPHLPQLQLRLSSSPIFSNLNQVGSSGRVASESRNWRSTSIGDFVFEDDEVDSDEEPEDRSLDLLVRFVQNMFRKLSKRTRKAARSVLPLSISTQLVGFSVNGVIILAFLWVLKAFLEVVCTFGSLVFVSILLIRGIWSGISYLQESRNNNANDFDDRAWMNAQPGS